MISNPNIYLNKIWIYQKLYISLHQVKQIKELRYGTRHCN